MPVYILVPVSIGGLLICIGVRILNDSSLEIGSLMGVFWIIGGGLVSGTALLIWVAQHIQLGWK